MRSSGSSDRRTTGHAAVVLRAVLLLLVGLGSGALARAGDRVVPGSVELPRIRISPTLRTGSGSVPIDAARFRPDGVATPRLERAPTRFYDAYLMPRLESQFGSLGAPYSAMPGVGSELGEFVMYDHLTTSARRGAENATGKALRDYLIEWSGVERLLELAPHPKTSLATRGGATLGFSVGFSHRMPEIGVRYRVGGLGTRLEVDGHGSVDIQFDRAAAASYSGVVLRFHPSEDAYGLSYRVDF